MSDEERTLRAVEALIFASSKPLSPGGVRKALPDMTPARVAEAVEQINGELAESGRPYEIALIDGGYQFRTRGEFADVLQAAMPERKVRLSKAALETLAVVAYRQPVTRAEIEDVRSVDCGAVLKSLAERDLVRIVGRRDVPGRPVLWGTTTSFLSTFGLGSLRDMPSLREIDAAVEEAGRATSEARGEGAADDAPEAPDADEAAIEDDREDEAALAQTPPESEAPEPAADSAGSKTREAHGRGETTAEEGAL